MRPARIIRLAVNKVIPNLPITIDSPVSEAIEVHICASEEPCAALILVAYWKGIVEPVGDVGGPLRSQSVILKTLKRAKEENGERYRDIGKMNKVLTSRVPIKSTSQPFKPVVFMTELTWYVSLRNTILPPWPQVEKASMMAGASSCDGSPLGCTVQTLLLVEGERAGKAELRTDVERERQMEVVRRSVESILVSGMRVQ